MTQYEIAEQHGALIAPEGIRRGDAAPFAAVVNHIIVQQRGMVDHLHHGRDLNVRRRQGPATLTGQQDQARPEHLAAAGPQMTEGQVV
jgi:hypothetical protein